MANLKLQGLQVCENEMCVSKDAREIYSYAIYIYNEHQMSLIVCFKNPISIYFFKQYKNIENKLKFLKKRTN